VIAKPDDGAPRHLIDAAANTVNQIGADGTSTVIAYIPNETPVQGLPTRDSTPTCAAVGPDGALYIGTLDLVRNFVDPNQGRATVYRVDPKAHEPYLTAAHLWATGLTTITSCAVDNAGNFWATEMFKYNTNGPPGDVVRIPFADPGNPEHIGGGQLPFPGGIAVGPDGAAYVAVFSAGTAAADGEVVRVSAG
jgi:sugar lactone lactonase YvrE